MGDPTDLVDNAPKALRPALWLILGVLAAGGVAIAANNAIEGKAALAAKNAADPLVDRISKLEAGQDRLWQTVSTKLDAISQQISDTNTSVRVLSQRLDDAQARKR